MLLSFVLLMLAPMIYALALSFTDFLAFSGHWHWIGIRNYTDLLNDPATWSSLWRTLLFAAIVIPLSIAGGLGLALLLNRRMHGVGVLRALVFLPYAVPTAAAAVAWKMMLDRDAGVLTWVVTTLGGPSEVWLDDPYVFYGLIAMTLWGMGYGMMILLAGLQGVPSELREAASVDGASRLQAFRHVTLPLLSPVILFLAIMGIINSLQTTAPLLLTPTDGGFATTTPAGTTLYMMNVYSQFYDNYLYGYASALLWFLVLFMVLLTAVLFGTSRLWVFYEAE